MSFTIKPISATLNKDLDTFTKMDPYVKLIIGNKKYRSKTHVSGGKKPTWNDTFEVIPNGNLLMKVQAWDQDVLKDDFLGEGYYNLSQLFNTPGITQNQYVDLVRYGKSFGRVLLSMKFNPPPQSQNFGPYQYQQPLNVQAPMQSQNYPYGYNSPPFQNYPVNNQTGYMNKPYQQGFNKNPYQAKNLGWNSQSNQQNIPPYQNQQNMWGPQKQPSNFPKGNNQNFPTNPYFSK